MGCFPGRCQTNIRKKNLSFTLVVSGVSTMTTTTTMINLLIVYIAAWQSTDTNETRTLVWKCVKERQRERGRKKMSQNNKLRTSILICQQQDVSCCVCSFFTSFSSSSSSVSLFCFRVFSARKTRYILEFNVVQQVTTNTI